MSGNEKKGGTGMRRYEMRAKWKVRKEEEVYTCRGRRGVDVHARARVCVCVRRWLPFMLP